MLTIATTESTLRPGYFGKGRYGGIVDFAINKVLDYLEVEEPYKYAKLPPKGRAISFKRKTTYFKSSSDRFI